MKSAIPEPLQEAIREVVFPVEVPDQRERTIEAGGIELTVRRRGEKVEVTLPSRDAEQTLRQWFGHDTKSLKEEGGSAVNGFLPKYEVVEGGERFDEQDHDPEDIIEVVLSIPRATLIVEVV